MSYELIVCKKCNGEMELQFSPCTDLSCCGIEHRLSCNCADYLIETYDLDELKAKYIELGGTEENFNTAWEMDA